MVGLEHANDNRGEPWPAAMYTASVVLTAAILTFLKQPSRWALAHREWSTTGKTDPVGIDMGLYRTAVAKHQKGVADMSITPQDVKAIVDGVWEATVTSDTVLGKDHKPQPHGVHEAVFNAIAAAKNSAEALKLLKGIDDKLGLLLKARGT